MTHSSSTLYFLNFLTVLIRTSAHHAEFRNYTIGNFTPNSAYAKNCNTILSSLSNNVSTHDGFYYTSTGQNPNTIYALTFCRGNALANICEICVSTTVHDLVEGCPNLKAALSWGTRGQPCFIRYSDTPIYGILQTDPTLSLHDADNITMSPEIWWNLTQGVANKAVDNSSKLKFATGQAKLPDNRTIFSLLQCTPHLSANDCRTCLDKAIDYYDECCRDRPASGLYKPSCILQWDLYPFLESSPSSSPSSPPIVSTGLGYNRKPENQTNRSTSILNSRVEGSDFQFHFFRNRRFWIPVSIRAGPGTRIKTENRNREP